MTERVKQAMGSLIWFIVVVVIVLAIVGLVMTAKQRRHSLQERFGPEYDRSVETAGGRRQAERELRDKAARRDQLDIRPLSAEARERYADEWALVQEGFVDEPGDSVDQADALVVRVMRERGYPVDDFETRTDMAAVDHPDVVEHYRAAHKIRTANRTGDADTEALRVAVVHYRWLFDALLLDESETAAETAAADDQRATANGKHVPADGPSAISDEPRPMANDHRTTLDGPSATADEPSATADEPSATADEPSAMTDEPRATTDEPRATTDEPRATTDEPRATTEDEPRARAEEPQTR
jgi:hypothetical protein